MREAVVDAHPIKSMVSWLDGEAKSIPRREMADSSSTADIGDLKRRIAAGEYRLDAHAIAEAMFGQADRVLDAHRTSEVFEARQVDDSAGGVDQL
jgi:Anti-sigma-28 factor, FlgM